MQYRPLGRTGLDVSIISLGTMTFGREADAAASAAIFHAARAAGVNVIDTADKYAGGESERIVGSLIAAERDDIILATKAGTPMAGSMNARGASMRHLRLSVEQSLQRLQTDRIDLYYIHYFDPHTRLEETLRCLDHLCASGKVLYPALSNFAAWQVVKALGVCALEHFQAPVAVQPMYSLLKRQAEVEILPMCASESLGVFVYSPLAAGILSGKYHGKHQSEQAARMATDPMYQQRYPDAAQYTVGQQFAELAQRQAVHPVTLANAWCLANDAVSSVIVGARSTEQLVPALAAGDYALSAELYDQCNALVPKPPMATDREEERANGFAVRQ